jgi:hypothetical protein
MSMAVGIQKNAASRRPAFDSDCRAAADLAAARTGRHFAGRRTAAQRLQMYIVTSKP